MTRIVVIGAGVGGLSAAAVLARAGFKVTVLEAQVYPEGCAGTYVHQSYRFDAGYWSRAGRRSPPAARIEVEHGCRNLVDPARSAPR